MEQSKETLYFIVESFKHGYKDVSFLVQKLGQVSISIVTMDELKSPMLRVGKKKLDLFHRLRFWKLRANVMLWEVGKKVQLSVD